jgi:hypothetical protein
LSGQQIPIGPFTGGLNTFSDPASVSSNELVVAQNVELDLDGSIKSRPPFVDTTVTLTLGATGNIVLLGYYYDTAGSPFLLATNGLNNTYFFTGSAWVSVFDPAAGHTAFAATAFTQYNGRAYLLAPEGGAGSSGYWISGGTYGTFTAETNMPKGNILVNYKDRLWVSGFASEPTKIRYSNILGDPAGFWVATPDFVDIGFGDGQEIVQVLVYYNTIMVFRSRSIWSYTYSDDPATGTVSQVVGSIGLSSKEAVVVFESYIYFMYDDRAYEFTNGRAAQLNLKVPFEAGSQAGIYMPFVVSEFNRRIIFSYYDTMFVYNLITRTWTSWNSTVYGSIGKIMKRESEDIDTFAYVHSSTAVTGATRLAKTLTISDVISASGEAMVCTMQTKDLDYSATAKFKRLFWWGVDGLFRGTLTATAFPISFSSQINWSVVRATTWGNIRNFTWSQPQTPQASVETVRTTAGTTPGRRLIKFLKSLRFRQINFKISVSMDGTLSTAPMRIYSLITYVDAKETVSKAIN